MSDSPDDPTDELDAPPVKGQQIADVRELTEAELDQQFVHSRSVACPTLVLENGTRLFPSRDPEGNGPGTFFALPAQEQPPYYDREQDPLRGSDLEALEGGVIKDVFGLEQKHFKTLFPPCGPRTELTIIWVETADDHYLVVPAADSELNGPGAIFGAHGDEHFVYC